MWDEASGGTEGLFSFRMQLFRQPVDTKGNFPLDQLTVESCDRHRFESKSDDLFRAASLNCQLLNYHGSETSKTLFESLHDSLCNQWHDEKLFENMKGANVQYPPILCREMMACLAETREVSFAIRGVRTLVGERERSPVWQK